MKFLVLLAVAVASLVDGAPPHGGEGISGDGLPQDIQAYTEKRLLTGSNDEPQESDKPDYYILALQTRGGLCFDGANKCTKLDENDTPPQWTIKGQWRLNAVTNEVYEKCPNITAYNASEMALLRLSLPTVWRGYMGVEGDDLWKAEWETRGGCAMQRHSDRNASKYFELSLLNYVTLDPSYALELEGIKPDDGKALKLKDFVAAIEKRTAGRKVDVICSQDKKKSAVQEVHFCLDPILFPVSCPSRSTSCPEDIYYLTVGSSAAGLHASFMLAMLATVVARFVAN